MRPAACALLALVLGSTPAHAGEDDRWLSVSLGYASFSVPDHDPRGGALAIEYERGFSDAMAVRATVGMGAYPVGTGSPGYSGHATLGLTYLFDITRYVPYVQLGLGGIALCAEELPTEFSPLLELGVGVDVLHSRSWSYGISARFESFIVDTSFFTAGLRVSYRWGFF